MGLGRIEFLGFGVQAWFTACKIEAQGRQALKLYFDVLGLWKGFRAGARQRRAICAKLSRPGR